MRCGSTGSRAGSASAGCEHRPGERGLSLIEALIAIVVVAIGLSGLYQSFANGVRAVPATEDHLAARQLAQSLMEEHLTARLMRTGRQRGRHDRFAWEIVMAPTVPAIMPPGRPGGWQLMEVAVVVTWDGRRSVRLDTLHLVKTQ